jgi:Rps23 Pro-64 3,4-dihydroxylase Tpa1-like proline 4-hydroxylase
MFAIFGRKKYSPRKTFFDYQQLADIAGDKHSSFTDNKPFPHILLEDLFAEDALQELLAAFPSPEALSDWRRADAKLDGQDMQLKKLGMQSYEAFPMVVRQLLLEMNAGPFVKFLELLTGVQALLPDPSLQGGGMHQSLPGAVLGVHADFTHHKVYGLDRRLNVLLYLNDNWLDEYEGHLELWSEDMGRCERRIRPLFGRIVIFQTDDKSYHGVPEPLACPEGMTRKSLALYYYSNGRSDKTVEATKKTEWRHAEREVLPELE